MDTMYIDGISRIHFINGMVRMEAFLLEPQAEGEPAQAGAGQLIMTPQGFLSALGAMQQLAQRLEESGVIQRTGQ